MASSAAEPVSSSVNGTSPSPGAASRAVGARPQLRTSPRGQRGVSADKRISQISQCSTGSNGSTRHKAQIGPWRLGRTLGRGSSGRVRLAKHVLTGRLAAVKIVPKSIAGAGGSPAGVYKGKSPEKSSNGSNAGPTFAYGIEREIVIMKLIEHPAVMRLYDVWENRGELYLVLEYIEGGELFDYLVSKGKLPEPEAASYFSQIISGVDYCHRFNICHRDLKPENLLLDKDKNIKIADFGMAVLEPHGKMLQTSCGSPHYASPEIVAGKMYHGASSDIWSCGIILFALLTGHLPFDDENIRSLLLKVKAGHFVMPPELSHEAKDLIWRMLDTNPDTRIRMPEIMTHPFVKKYRGLSMMQRAVNPPPYSFVEHPVPDEAAIDREILKSLMILWRGERKSTVVRALLSPEPNAEKQFYSLLLRYRQDRLENYGADYDGTSSPSRVLAAASSLSKPTADSYNLGQGSAGTGTGGVGGSATAGPCPAASPSRPVRKSVSRRSIRSTRSGRSSRSVRSAAVHRRRESKSPAASTRHHRRQSSKASHRASVRGGHSKAGAASATTAATATKAAKGTSSSRSSVLVPSGSVAFDAAIAAMASSAEPMPQRGNDASVGLGIGTPSPSPSGKFAASHRPRDQATSTPPPLPPLARGQQAAVARRTPQHRQWGLNGQQQLRTPGSGDSSERRTRKVSEQFAAEIDEAFNSAAVASRPLPVRPEEGAPTNEQAPAPAQQYLNDITLELDDLWSVTRVQAADRYTPTRGQAKPQLLAGDEAADQFADAEESRYQARSVMVMRKRSMVAEPDNSDSNSNSLLLRSRKEAAVEISPSRRPQTRPHHRDSLRPVSEVQHVRIVDTGRRPEGSSARAVSEPLSPTTAAPSQSVEDRVFSIFRRKSRHLTPNREAPPAPPAAGSSEQDTSRRRSGRWSIRTASARSQEPATTQSGVDDEEAWTTMPSPPMGSTADAGGSNGNGLYKRSFFSRLFNIKPASAILQACAVDAPELREHITQLLRKWEAMNVGIRAVTVDPTTKAIHATIKSRNALHIKGLQFSVHVIQWGSSGSRAIFTQVRGAKSSFDRVVNEFRTVFATNKWDTPEKENLQVPLSKSKRDSGIDTKHSSFASAVAGSDGPGAAGRRPLSIKVNNSLWD